MTDEPVQPGELGTDYGHGPVTVERTWNKHAERIPDRWTWDVVDDAGVVVSVVDDDDTPAENIARLIAAAPTIVALLRRLVKRWPLRVDSWDDTFCSHCEGRPQLAQESDIEFLHLDDCAWMQAADLLMMPERDGHAYASQVGRTPQSEAESCLHEMVDNLDSEDQTHYVCLSCGARLQSPPSGSIETPDAGT